MPTAEPAGPVGVFAVFLNEDNKEVTEDRKERHDVHGTASARKKLTNYHSSGQPIQREKNELDVAKPMTSCLSFRLFTNRNRR